MTFESGRFVLFTPGDDGRDYYITSFDTWEECEVAFPIENGNRLRDDHTGRTWFPNSRYEWEDCQT